MIFTQHYHISKAPLKWWTIKKSTFCEIVKSTSFSPHPGHDWLPEFAQRSKASWFKSFSVTRVRSCLKDKGFLSFFNSVSYKKIFVLKFYHHPHPPPHQTDLCLRAFRYDPLIYSTGGGGQWPTHLYPPLLANISTVGISLAAFIVLI